MELPHQYSWLMVPALEMLHIVSQIFFLKASILGATPSTSPTTGALIVSGGTGIAGDLNVGGNAEITGELTVGSFTLAGSFSLSGLNLSSVIKNTDYSLTDGDYTVEFNCGVNNLVATLPASPDVGQIYNICKGDNGMGFVTLQGNGYTINGVPSRSTAVQYFVWTIQFNGVEWRIL